VTGFQVGPSTLYVFSYQAFDADDEPASEPEVTVAVFGTGQILPGVEAALEGKTVGDRVEVRLAAGTVFGARRASSILEVDRADFPRDVAPGDRFELENAAGDLLVAHVLEVLDDLVVIDTNHPLAEQDVILRGELLEVRPASADELRAAELALEEDMALLNASPPDVGVAALIRPADRG
jgi:FKBP-type peptidyl-prolyl cis-trans isomerase SlyD